MFFLAGKLKMYLIIGTLFATIVGAAYWYYKDTQAVLKQYAENNAKLEFALDTQTQATESLKRDIVLMTNTIADLNKEFEKARQRVAQLESTFNESANGESRDFGELAVAKPGLIEKIVNKGTDEVSACIEILSGNQGDYSDKERSNCTGQPVVDDGV